jgi:hypothetical protein
LCIQERETNPQLLHYQAHTYIKNREINIASRIIDPRLFSLSKTNTVDQSFLSHMVPYATFGHPALYTKGTQLIYIRNVNKYICPTRRTKTNEERYLYNTYNRIAYDKFVARPMKNGSRPAAERVAQRAVARIKVREMIESLALIGRSIRRAKPLVCGSAAHKGRRARVAPIPSDKGRRLAIQ